MVIFSRSAARKKNFSTYSGIKRRSCERISAPRTHVRSTCEVASATPVACSKCVHCCELSRSICIVKTLRCIAACHSIHATMNLAGSVSPLLKVSTQVVERVTVFREDQKLAPAICQLVKLRIQHTPAQGFEL